MISSDSNTTSKEDVNLLLQRKKVALYSMTTWFWFEHIFILIYLAVGQSRTSAPIIISNILAFYWAFFGWRYLPPKIEIWKLKYNYVCQFWCVVILEILYVFICSYMATQGFITSINEKMKWFNILGLIGNTLGLISLILLGYLVFLSFKIYTNVFKNDDIVDPRQSDSAGQS